METQSGGDPVQLDGFTFRDLLHATGLQRLDDAFRERLQEDDPDLAQRLNDFRMADAPPAAREHSQLLLDMAPHVEAFIACLFGIEEALEHSRQRTVTHNPILRFKQEYVLQRARRRKREYDGFWRLDSWLREAVGLSGQAHDEERAVAEFGLRLLDDPEGNSEAIDRLSRWCAIALHEPEGRRRVAGWTSFRLPSRVDPANLVPVRTDPADSVGRLHQANPQFRHRDGFRLADPRMSARAVQAEVHYCIYCHDHDGDFCSKGFPEKKKQPDLGFKVNPLGSILTGCPLEEKISEMHLLKRDGRTIAALATCMVDNPMVPATGHRICNDCMKACIYQKQDPVDIPQIETRILTDVLYLPWGVEIYHLLTRWNPMRHRQYVAATYNGYRVLIAGLGPSGFTMAHHLTMEGCAVVGIDGLKIESLPKEILEQPIRHYGELIEPLNERINYGFGGVAEYGITVRWDKNFLKLIQLTLSRRENFQVFGGVRLGGTLTLEDAWSLGFDHVCNACGTGLPRVVSMGNSLARGMRQASDFLMALQLTGAAKSDSLANLQVRLPAVVIGGGLTAIDTATEIQAYYIAQVEKILSRYEALTARHGQHHVYGQLDSEGRATLNEMLAHGREVRAERERAAQAGQIPDFLPLLRRWGGVTIVYRRGLNESPAYLRNHEEVQKALEEGIHYLEGMEPIRAELDGHGHVTTLVCRRLTRHEGRWLRTSQEVRLSARGIFVAAGTVPNTIYEREHRNTFELESDHFQPHVYHRQALQPVQAAQHPKEPEFGPFTSYQADGHYVTFIGDTHPAFHGSVVNAIASGLRTYPQVMLALYDKAPHSVDHQDLASFQTRMADLLTARVEAVRSEHPAVIELQVRAPMAARNFRPGQFYRLQTFETCSPVIDSTRLQVPLQTVSGAGTNGDVVRLFVLRGGTNGRLLERLRPGEPLVLMGPTGTPAPLAPQRTVMVVAGRWGAAVMLALGPALRAAGCRVLYFASFPDAGQVFQRDEIEDGADSMVWATGQGTPIQSRRPNDLSVVNADIVDVIRQYGRGELTDPERLLIPLNEVDEILVMGATGLLAAVRDAIAGDLNDLFRTNVQVTGTIGSPMQCMLQGVCAQCLQWQVDPDTRRRTRAVFTCAMQDQPLFWVDLDNLAARQGQNRLQEQLTDLWVEDVLNRAPGIEGVPR